MSNFDNKRKAISATEFSSVSGVPGATIRRWLEKKQLKGTKIGRKWLIPMKEVQKIINPE